MFLLMLNQVIVGIFANLPSPRGTAPGGRGRFLSEKMLRRIKICLNRIGKITYNTIRNYPPPPNARFFNLELSSGCLLAAAFFMRRPNKGFNIS